MVNLKAFLVVIVLVAASPLKAQIVTYDDVAVIYNVNSLASQEIATYFQAARNIPTVNMIPVNVPEVEHTTMEVFQDLREQVEEYLIENQLTDTINYLVTTKGVPFRIGLIPCNTPGTFSDCSSVESELTLILGPDSDEIGSTSYIANPYLNSVTKHSRSESGIFLVTRLDGYKVDDVIELIDRSGPDQAVIKEQAIFIADVNGQPPVESNIWHSYFNLNLDPLNSSGWNTLIDTVSAVVVDGHENVLGYIGLEQQPMLSVPEFQWMPGGLAMEWMGLSAMSFFDTEPEPGYRRVADRIAEGASGARGDVGVTYAGVLQLSHPTFDRYTDTSLHFNLAESYYAGIGKLSSTELVIGDPKTSITLTGPTDISSHDHSDQVLAFPNPSQGIFNISVSDQDVRSISVFDIRGRNILTRTHSPGSPLILDLMSAADGIYFVKLLSRDGQSSIVRVEVQR